jgi:hypothetical protein
VEIFFGRGPIGPRQFVARYLTERFRCSNLSDVGIGSPMRIETDDLGSQTGSFVRHACISGTIASGRCNG